MLGIASIGSPGDAAKYYAKDNYYTKDEGIAAAVWFGKGAEIQGLAVPGKQKGSADTSEADPVSAGNASDVDREATQGREPSHPTGPREKTADPGKTETDTRGQGEMFGVSDMGSRSEGVTAERLSSLLRGEVQGKRLGREYKGEWQHDPGKDLGFSASKSVSIMALVAQDDRIVKAFQESVQETLSYAERNMTYVRDRSGEKNITRPTGNMTAALFTHDTSRAQDPDLHIHAVVANMTQDPKTGNWRSLWMSPLYKNRYKLSNMQDAILGQKLHALGYDVYRGKHGFTEIRGVPDDLSKTMSSRRNAMKDHMEESQDWNARQRSAYATRDRKTAIDRKILVPQWQKVAAAHGFDYERLKGRALTKAGEREAPEAHRQWVKDAVFRNIRNMTQTNTTLERAALVEGTVSTLRGTASVERIERTIDVAIERGALIEHSRRVAGELRYTTPEAIRQEELSRARVVKGADARPIVSDGDAVDRRLAMTPLDDNQRPVAKFLLTSSGQYLGVQAAAGAGKTFTIGQAVNALNSLQGADDSIRFVGMAPTKNAAKVLGTELRTQSMTVQKFLALGAKSLDTEQPLHPRLAKMKGEGIVVDESSLIGARDAERFTRLVEAIGISKVVLIGDRQQHEGVQAGPVFRLLQDTEMRTVVLEGIRRQRNVKLRAAVEAAAAGRTTDFYDRLRPYIKASPDAYIENAAQEINTMRVRGRDVIAMTADNRTRRSLESAIRSDLKDRNRLGPNESLQRVARSTYLGPDETRRIENYQVNDRLAFTRSVSSLGIKAGEIWGVKGTISTRDQVVLQRGDREVHFNVSGHLKRAPFEHMQLDTLALSKGDRVRFTGSDRAYGVERAQEGELRKISSRHFTIAMDDGRKLKIDRRSNAAMYLDYGYVDTTYAAQGKTNDIAVAVLDPRSGATSEAALYVAASRARDDAMIFTSSETELEQTILRQSGHDVAATEARGYDPEERERKRERLEAIKAEREAEKDDPTKEASKADKAPASKDKGENESVSKTADATPDTGTQKGSAGEAVEVSAPTPSRDYGLDR